MVQHDHFTIMLFYSILVCLGFRMYLGTQWAFEQELLTSLTHWLGDEWISVLTKRFIDSPHTYRAKQMTLYRVVTDTDSFTLVMCSKRSNKTLTSQNDSVVTVWRINDLRYILLRPHVMVLLAWYLGEKGKQISHGYVKEVLLSEGNNHKMSDRASVFVHVGLFPLPNLHMMSFMQITPTVCTHNWSDGKKYNLFIWEMKKGKFCYTIIPNCTFIHLKRYVK